MTYETLELIVEDKVATLRLNRPKAYNAMNMQMIYEIEAVCREINASSEIRAVVFTATGKAFCAGGDVKEMLFHGNKRTSVELLCNLDALGRATKALVGIDKPVITAVNGIATGAGVSMAMAGDVIYAVDTATFSEIFANIGLNPDMGSTWLLPRLVGPTRAKELIFTNRMVPAQEALEIGLVNKLFPEAELMDEAYKLARRLADGPTHAYALAKRMVNQSFEHSLATALDYEGFSQVISHQSEDYLEGIIAFQEKRKPVFNGR